MASYILEPTTDEMASDPFVVSSSKGGATHVTAPGLSEGEAVTMQIQAINKSVNEGWFDYYLNGELQQITNVHSGVAVHGAGTYRAVKSATTSEVGVQVSTGTNP